MERVTEKQSKYNDLEKMSVAELCKNMNEEDKTVPLAIEKSMDQIVRLATATSEVVKNGGRIFYIGSGTSGRLGILDASECPPTYGVPQGIVVGLISGGDVAIRKAVEGAEDSTTQAWVDLQEHMISDKDIVIGIAASGSTPYVVGGVKKCKEQGIRTGCIVCNPGSVLAGIVDFPVEVIVGPEFVTGSTRMKSGTAQKLVLNMISTSTMIQLGRVKGNRMVDMALANNKLVDRGTKMVMDELKIPYEEANALLLEHGSVRKAIVSKGGDPPKEEKS